MVWWLIGAVVLAVAAYWSKLFFQGELEDGAQMGCLAGLAFLGIATLAGLADGSSVITLPLWAAIGAYPAYRAHRIQRERDEQRRKQEDYLASRYTWPDPKVFRLEVIPPQTTLPLEFLVPLLDGLEAFYAGTFRVRSSPIEQSEGENEYRTLVTLALESIGAFEAVLKTVEFRAVLSPLAVPLASAIGYGTYCRAIEALGTPFKNHSLTEPMLRYASQYRLYEDTSAAGKERVNRKLEQDYGLDDALVIQAFDKTPYYVTRRPLRRAFLDNSVPYWFPPQTRFEHMHIVAGTGHGKTQTLQSFIPKDLQTDAGLVIIDSQGEMLRKIEALNIDKEIIYVDPADVDHPPALNMFDVTRLAGVPPAKREQFLNGLIELLEYVFAGLLKAELTQKQNVLFRYTLRLLLVVPNATLMDLVRVLSDPTPYLAHIAKLNPMVQEFFRTEFRERSYTQTREQIRRRLFGVLENDAFRRMFSSQRNLVNVAEALDRGAVVLVDTNKAHLKGEASSLLGRYFIALTLQAAIERQGRKNPAFLYIDEAGEYFDDNIDSLLNEARKRRLGIVMAHQYLDQLTPNLRSSIATNTAIKLAGGISDRDARALAPDMRTDASQIIAQPKFHFMCFIKNFTPRGLAVETIPFQLEAFATLTPARSLAYSAPAEEQRPDGPETVPLSAHRAEDKSDDAPNKDITPTTDW